MNNKETELHKIVDIVVSCCATQIDDDGTMSLTRDDVLGKSREENVVMTRAILSMCIISAGYSVTTVAQLLHRTPQAIRHLINLGHQYYKTSRAFRIANAEATIKLKDIEAGGL